MGDDPNVNGKNINGGKCYGMKTLMKDELNGWQPQWKMTFN